ncbi:bifunctional oligoribonuclease/PAP phosphatase NrnA [Candidatus Peregrinibacteria bacterium]|nr:bifunctional oligoribonuclease/PAP phosphatase NrnA [Candidatus Peregrinibacteria bacterium]
MKLDQKELGAIKKALEGATTVLLIPHKNPDGDTIGSAFGLYNTLLEMGKKPTVACIDEPPPVFKFIPGIETIQVGIDHIDYDVIIIVDAGATHLTGVNEQYPQLFDKSREVINIDHHPTNDYYGKYNVVVPTAAATTMIIYQMLVDMDFPLSRQTATALLTGIYTDTGSFIHSNTNSEALRIAARLLARGANLRGISKDIFNTTKISTMRLWGRVLKNTYQTPDGVTMSVVKQKDFEECKATYDEMSGVVDYVNSVPNASYSVILTEKGGAVKGSLRTLNDHIDVSAIASHYGGGGHTKAAGFTVKGRLEQELRWKVVD